MAESSTALSTLVPFIENLKSTAPSRLFYFYGQEYFLIQEALSLLQKKILTEQTKDFNYEVLSAKDVSAARIISSARTLPMMASQRLVIVKEAHELSANETNQMIQYLENPSSHTCLCFIAEKADLRLRFFSIFKKNGFLLKLDPITERQLPSFLKAEAKKWQLSFAEGAMELMIERIGSNLSQLHEKMIQISCYLEPQKTIQQADVNALIPPSVNGGVFDLIDAIFKKNKTDALSLLKQILSQKEPILRIFSLLSRQIRLLLFSKQWITNHPKISSTEIAKELGVPPFVAIKLLEQIKNRSQSDFIFMQEKLYETEKLLKNSRMDGEYYLEQFILVLLRN